MKTYNQKIKVEVEVDSIAAKVLSMFKSEEKHAELLTEAIISTALDMGTISHIYSAAHGHTGDINFQEGDIVDCIETDYYRSTPTGEMKRQKIGACTVIAVNRFKSKPLTVGYQEYDSSGKEIAKTTSVGIKQCSLMPIEVETDSETAEELAVAG